MNILEKYGAGERIFAEASMYEGEFPARVISQYGSLYAVATAKSECLAELSGKLRHEAKTAAELPAVGDFVMVDREDAESGNAVIARVLTRKSVFERTSAGDEHQSQIVAANADVVFLCMSLNANYSLNRLERYLSVAWDSRAVPVVVLTKSDLCAELARVMAEISAIAPGTDIIATSKDDSDTAEKLLKYLPAGRTGCFIGSSGVGKSTLINLLAGREILETGEIRGDDKGRHTTTRRELLPLPNGAVVIDTPGMRALGVESVDLDKAFPEIEALAARCRFSDCSHVSEPGCAVRAAVEAGVLSERRLESWRKLRRETKYEGLNSRQLESEKCAEMFGDIGGMKKVRKYIRDTNKRKGAK